MKKNPEIISRKIAYECPIFKVEERRVVLKNSDAKGKEKKNIEKTFWVIVRPPNVTIVALTKDKRIVLIKEMLKGKECIVLPGGKVEKYDVSEKEIREQALKELQEETGFSARRIELLHKEESPWNTLDRKFYCFLAWDLEDVGQELEEGETISRYLVSIQEAEKIIDRREMTSPEEERNLIKALSMFRKKKLI
ncbi:NUDIX hydrolase [Candidatus Woesearchaeota archaeon]|nr:NUDIX hydrolase [Candidatus Woesearchaeota archaeon]